MKYLPFILFFALISCQKPIEKENSKMLIDFNDREVQIPSEVNKIVCLNPGSVRFISYFNEVDKIVAVEENEKNSGTPYFFANPQILDKPIVGNNRIIEPELVAASDADIIISTFYTTSKSESIQTKTKIPLFNFHYGDINQSMNDFDKALVKLGIILNDEQRAMELISGINEFEKDLLNRTKDLDELRNAFICGVAYRGVQGVSSTEPFYKPFKLVNLSNVASQMDSQLINPIKGTYIEIEKIADWNPEFIFIDASGLDLIKADIKRNPEFYKHLEAFKNERIYAVYPYNWYALNYSSLLANAYFIGKIVYPEMFEDINPELKAGEIYSFFFGKNVYPEMKETFDGFRKISKEELFGN